MTAPHLPPKTNSILWHERWRFLRAILVIVAISLAAGATAALVVLAWYPDIIGRAAPRYIFTPYATDDNPKKPPTQDAGLLTQTIRNAHVSLYRAADVARGGGESWYAKSAAIGEGVLVTGDGWLVTVTAALRISTDIRVIDARGVVYPIEKQVHDPVSGLSFVKIAGQNVTVVPLVNDTVPKEGDEVLTLGSAALSAREVGEVAYRVNAPLASDRVTRLFRVDADVPAGAPVFTASGSLLGIAAHDAEFGATIVPIAGITSLMPLVFGNKEIPAHTVRISYLMMPDVTPMNSVRDEQAPRIGAQVTRVQKLSGARGSMPSLAQGDIILAVNDKSLSLARDLALILAEDRGTREVLLTVYRDGEQLRMPVQF